MNPVVIDLTIPLHGLDTDHLLHDWRWLVSDQYTPIQMSKFGWWFFSDPIGRVFMLDLIEGELQRIASSVAEFNEKKKTEGFQSEWFLAGFVFRCHGEGLLLGPDQCYMWKIPPLLGGKFEFENIAVALLVVCQTLMGQLFQQAAEKGPDFKVTGFKIG